MRAGLISLFLLLCTGCAMPTFSEPPAMLFDVDSSALKQSQSAKVNDIKVRVGTYFELTGKVDVHDYLGDKYAVTTLNSHWLTRATPKVLDSLNGAFAEIFSEDEGENYQLEMVITKLSSNSVLSSDIESEVTYIFTNELSGNQTQAKVKAFGACSMGEYLEGILRTECSRIRSLRNNISQLASQLSNRQTVLQ